MPSFDPERATSAWLASREMRAGCVCVPTTQGVNVWFRSPGTSSSVACCNTCCPRGSSAFVVPGCWRQRPRASAWVRPGRCWRCHRRWPSRTLRPSLAAWLRWTSTPARIAAVGGCGWCSCWRRSVAQRPIPWDTQLAGGHHECGWVCAQVSSQTTAQWPWGALRANDCHRLWSHGQRL